MSIQILFRIIYLSYLVDFRSLCVLTANKWMQHSPMSWATATSEAQRNHPDQHISDIASGEDFSDYPDLPAARCCPLTRSSRFDVYIYIEKTHIYTHYIHVCMIDYDIL